MRSTAAILTLLGLLASCQFNPFCGNQSIGDYDLVSIAGDPLPAPFVVQGARVLVTVVSSRIRLRSNHRGEEVVRQLAQGQTSPVEVTNQFGFTIEGNPIQITYDCPDLASCIAGPHLEGWIDDQGMAFSRALGLTPLWYVRRCTCPVHGRRGL